MSIEKLFLAIEEHDMQTIKHLLSIHINPNICLENEAHWGTLGEAIYELDEGGSMETISLLFKYGANVNMSYSGLSVPIHSALANRNIERKEYINIIILLLNYGANPNIWNPEFASPLVMSTQNDDIKIIEILLKYGAKYSTAEIIKGICGCSALHKASQLANILIIKLLLDYGFDTSLFDDANKFALWYFPKDDTNYTEAKTLLNPNNPPYLKLGNNDEDKYIIYENELIEEGYLPHPQPFLLADKKKYKEKKYLYTDNKIDTFIYWCYKKDVLIEPTKKVIENYLSKIDKINYKTIGTMLKQTLGEKVTTELFEESGKEFARAYLTVTHWWYNLHTDFNRLFNEKDKKPKAIENQDEFDTMLKLLDIRYEQFKSGEDFNSNQNREEVEALLEGREPPKRVVDLSFLEDERKEEEQEAKFIPFIQLKSKELAPKAGRYQATLPKGHPDEEFVKEPQFIQRVAEGKTIGTFGLIDGNEELIVWVYLGE